MQRRCRRAVLGRPEDGERRHRHRARAGAGSGQGGAEQLVYEMERRPGKREREHIARSFSRYVT